MVTDLEEGPGSWMGPKSSRKTKDQRSLMETRSCVEPRSSRKTKNPRSLMEIGSCVEPKSASKTKLTPLMGAEVVGSPMNSRSPLGAEMGSDDSWTPERASSIEEERLNQMACQTRITSIQSDFQWVLR